jgi:pimeloyl-ACP methyl ester carboxylesterase
MEPQIRYTTTEDGASIAYATMGAGPFVIVVPSVHLFSGRLRVFPHQRAMLETLAREFTAVLYDGRGMGLSSRDRPEYGLDAKFHDLEAVIAAVGAETFSLYGPSFGGLTAMAYAARHPQRVASLVLLDSFSAGEKFYRGSPLGRILDALGVVTAEQWASVSDMIGSQSAYLPATGELNAARDIGALLRETWTPDEFMAHRLAVRAIDLRDELGTMAVPTLIVANTSWAVFEHSRELASAIPNARLTRYTATWDRWDEADSAALVAFLREHAGVAAPPTFRAASAPSSVRTVLFTDLVGHSEMMRRLGDARGREVLREHERITRETIAAHGGVEIKTDGDSFMVSFGSVASAVECAIALQRAFDHDLTPRHSESATGPSPSSGEGGVRLRVRR